MKSLTLKVSLAYTRKVKCFRNNPTRPYQHECRILFVNICFILRIILEAINMRVSIINCSCTKIQAIILNVSFYQNFLAILGLQCQLQIFWSSHRLVNQVLNLALFMRLDHLLVSN